MAVRNFPPSGNAAIDAVKEKAGYVQFSVFSDAGVGYFCGTCRAFCPEEEGQGGFCQGLKVPVVTFGCCNNWSIAPEDEWLAADGEPL
jgi:hypothetical protein